MAARKSLADAVFGGGILVFVLGILAVTLSTGPTRNRASNALLHTEMLLADLSTACKSYQVTFGSYPPEDRNQSSKVLHKWLSSVRPGSAHPLFVFTSDRLEGNPENTAPSPPREIVDAWGRPLRYGKDDPWTWIRIRSAGEDGIWDTEDDIPFPPR